MNLKKIINVINHIAGETHIPNAEIYQYDLNNNGKIDVEDFIELWRLYATNTDEVKTFDTGKLFRTNIKKLFRSNILTEYQKDLLQNSITSISKENIVEVETDKKMFKTEKGAKLFNAQHTIK
jgi:predicted methyltransferase